MKRNLGLTDRALRLSFGLIIALVGVGLGSPWGIIGALLAWTGMHGTCPAYHLLGINTRRSHTAV